MSNSIPDGLQLFFLKVSLVCSAATRGLRPTLPPRLGSIVALAQVCLPTCFVVACVFVSLDCSQCLYCSVVIHCDVWRQKNVVARVVVSCLCTMFLGPLLGIFLFDYACLQCTRNCQNDPRILLKSQKMLLEVAPGLHGEPLVQKMCPG